MNEHEELDEVNDNEEIEYGAFFGRPIHEVAVDLLGRRLVTSQGGVERVGRIVEVEVYEGANDRASHARSGEPTGRSWPMFEAPGTIYVYKIYGRYRCLNFRAGAGEGPGAILIRACEPVRGLEAMAVGRGLVKEAAAFLERDAKKLMSGPAKLTQALGVDGSLNGTMVGEGLWLEEGEAVSKSEVAQTVRIGLNRKTCGDCVDRPWRYVVAGSKWLSR